MEVQDEIADNSLSEEKKNNLKVIINIMQSSKGLLLS